MTIKIIPGNINDILKTHGAEKVYLFCCRAPRWRSSVPSEARTDVEQTEKCKRDGQARGAGIQKTKAILQNKNVIPTIFFQ